MAYVITGACIDVKDKACVDVCPMDCIYEEGENDRMLYIHPDECIDCGACEPECPVGAIFYDSDVPEEAKPFTALNALYFKNKQTTRIEINRLYPLTEV